MISVIRRRKIREDKGDLKCQGERDSQCAVLNKTVSVLLEEEKCENRLEGGERLSQVIFLGKSIPEEGIGGGERALRLQGKTHSVP